LVLIHGAQSSPGGLFFNLIRTGLKTSFCKGESIIRESIGQFKEGENAVIQSYFKWGEERLKERVKRRERERERLKLLCARFCNKVPNLSLGYNRGKGNQSGEAYEELDERKLCRAWKVIP